MSYQCQGHADQARRLLRQAVEKMDQDQRERPNRVWNDPLRWEILRREAEALVTRP
jgi:hypothetical protein